MAINSAKTEVEWEQDTALSVDFYNNWFTGYAPRVFQETRITTAEKVKKVMGWTKNLTDISAQTLLSHPEILPTLRMATCPPIARDRLVGLSGAKKSVVDSMEKNNRVPPQMKVPELIGHLTLISDVLTKMTDPDIFPWLQRKDTGSEAEVEKASTIIADRLCGAEADPIIRNAQEKRQLDSMKEWLEARGYRELQLRECDGFRDMPNGTFSFRLNVPVNQPDGEQVNIPVDAVIMRMNAMPGDFPALFEAKSAGDFTNTNKRRKEEAAKMDQLKSTYGADITFDLFLCGYFNKTYLKYEKSHGIDWVWEHRIDDLELFGF
ncbi:TPA: XamI family restriction endonuclease [Vibrio vulnificus]|nr:XamI family restriction endonuclease [Vibrio vulnificus]